MSKFVAERSYRMINENNDLVVCYVVHGDNKRSALLALEETQVTEKKLEVEVSLTNPSEASNKTNSFGRCSEKWRLRCPGTSGRCQPKSVIA